MTSWLHASRYLSNHLSWWADVVRFFLMSLSNLASIMSVWRIGSDRFWLKNRVCDLKSSSARPARASRHITECALTSLLSSTSCSTVAEMTVLQRSACMKFQLPAFSGFPRWERYLRYSQISVNYRSATVTSSARAAAKVVPKPIRNAWSRRGCINFPATDRRKQARWILSCLDRR